MTKAGFVMGFEDNAVDSLIHAVSHLNDATSGSSLKYSILHTVHAVELFLKARLAKEHWVLIYDSPEKAPSTATDDYRTVDFPKLIQRLQKSGVEVSKGDLKVLKALRNTRNQIEHHRVEISSQMAQQRLGQAMFS